MPRANVSWVAVCQDASLVRRIVEGVVRDHEQRSLTGLVAPVGDVEALVGELVARVSGFGPLQPFLDDPTVEEVWINDPSRVFIARNGRHELTNLMLSAGQVHELVERMLKSSGRRVDVSQPFVDAMLPEGHRLHVVLEGISRGFSAVNIRKFVLKAARLSDLVELDTLSPRAEGLLRHYQSTYATVLSCSTSCGSPPLGPTVHKPGRGEAPNGRGPSCTRPSVGHRETHGPG
ncbi:MAG TPA: ATPase, T2SS/T4P/T4SS family [Nocardioides sp.]|nr:ATPase, T2SS/T4P/T4SS family [Nocardioides sp.]